MYDIIKIGQVFNFTGGGEGSFSRVFGGFTRENWEKLTGKLEKYVELRIKLIRKIISPKIECYM